MQSPDGFRYSEQLAEASFGLVAITGMILERHQLTGAIAGIVSGHAAGGDGAAAFVASYTQRAERLREIACITRRFPPAHGMGGF